MHRFRTTLVALVATAVVAPSCRAGNQTGLLGLVARYDTQASFGAAAAWVTFNTSTVAGLGAQPAFSSAVFDGRFFYFTPAGGGVAARFDAKMPPSEPKLPAFFGSLL